MSILITTYQFKYYFNTQLLSSDLVIEFDNYIMNLNSLKTFIYILILYLLCFNQFLYYY